MSTAVAHDYLTQRGGAERVVLSLLCAFPDAPVYTSLYQPETTFADFARADVRTSPINRLAPLRHDHLLALPVLAPAFSALTIDAEVTVCSSTGWAHGVRTTGRKVVYCHNPARWLYQTDQYLGPDAGLGARAACAVLKPPLKWWDRAAARSADRYIVNSMAVRDRVWRTYGIHAEVLNPPPALTADHPQSPLDIEAGYWLSVSRLLPYKNVAQIVEAFHELKKERLVVVGTGPEAERLRAKRPPNVTFLAEVNDDELAWLYAHSCGLVAASYEDFGLTPLEANAFGKPVAALAWGGYLETIEPDVNGMLFATADPASIAATVKDMGGREWDGDAIRGVTRRFSKEAFIRRIRQVVDELAA